MRKMCNCGEISVKTPLCKYIISKRKEGVSLLVSGNKFVVLTNQMCLWPCL